MNVKSGDAYPDKVWCGLDIASPDFPNTLNFKIYFYIICGIWYGAPWYVSQTIVRMNVKPDEVKHSVKLDEVNDDGKLDDVKLGDLVVVEVYVCAQYK